MRLLWLALGGLALWGCSPSPGAPAQLPDFVLQASAQTQEAYRYAAAHPEVLQYMPCYCGCVNQGHTSNKDCFIKELRRDGSVVYDAMGST